MTVAHVVYLLLPLHAQVIETVAGGGAGDGGPAIQANLAGPEGVAVDRAGNVYIADTSNHRVRKIDPGGTIHTIAGDGLPGALRFPVGVTVSASGEVFIADTYNHRIVRADGTVVKAQLNLPSSVDVLADGTLLIADSGNGRIVAVNPGGMVRPIASGLSRPISVVGGEDGQVYFSDSGLKRIARVDRNGRVNEIVRLPRPFGIAFNARGQLFVSDEERGQVLRIDTAGVVPVASGLASPQGIAVDGSGNIYVAEFGRNVVRMVSSDGISRIVAGNGEAFFSGDGGSARSAALNYPHGIALDRAGNLWIADTENNRVRKVSPGGKIATVASGLARPLGVAIDEAGNAYVADTNGHRVLMMPAAGPTRTVAGKGVAGFGGDAGPASGAMLNYPSAVAVGGDALYIADSGNRRIRMVADGRIHTVAENLPGPSAIAVDESGNLWIADRADHRIRRLTTQGRLEVVNTGTLSRPLGIAVDSRRHVFISDSDSHRVIKVDESGRTTVVTASTADLRAPAGLAVGLDGSVYISDSGHHRIRRLLGVAASSPILSKVSRPPAFSSSSGLTVSNSLAPYVATPADIALRMLDMARVTPADVVYDLGCGDGRIPILAASRFGARAVGIEIDAALVTLARERVRQAGVGHRVTIEQGDIMSADLASATVIVLYLLPEALPKLRPVMEKGVHRPVRVISHDARIEGWTPTTTESVPGESGRVHLLYRYDINPR